MKFNKPPYIIEVNGFFWNKKTRGCAIYPFIFTTNINDEVLMRHEMIHIKQELRGWLIGYYIKYYYYQIRYGYDENPYEIEAREKSK